MANVYVLIIECEMLHLMDRRCWMVFQNVHWTLNITVCMCTMLQDIERANNINVNQQILHKCTTLCTPTFTSFSLFQQNAIPLHLTMRMLMLKEVHTLYARDTAGNQMALICSWSMVKCINIDRQRHISKSVYIKYWCTKRIFECILGAFDHYHYYLYSIIVKCIIICVFDIWYAWHELQTTDRPI